MSSEHLDSQFSNLDFYVKFVKMYNFKIIMAETQCIAGGSDNRYDS